MPRRKKHYYAKLRNISKLHKIRKNDPGIFTFQKAKAQDKMPRRKKRKQNNLMNWNKMRKNDPSNE